MNYTNALLTFAGAFIACYGILYAGASFINWCRMLESEESDE